MGARNLELVHNMAPLSARRKMQNTNDNFGFDISRDYHLPPLCYGQPNGLDAGATQQPAP